MPDLEQLPLEFNFAADFGPCCIWTDQGGSSLDCFLASDALKSRAAEWISNYFEDAPSPIGQSQDDFNHERLEIVKELKLELGPTYKITYTYLEGRTDSPIFKKIIL